MAVDRATMLAEVESDRLELDLSQEDRQPRVLIVDDHRLFAEAIRRVLVEAGASVVGIAHSEGQALQAARRDEPDLVLLDVGLRQGDGIELARGILASDPSTKIVAVTDVQDARRVREALGCGFSGYVTKETPAAQFLASIRAVLAGVVVVPQRVGDRTVTGVSSEEEAARRSAEHLTSREREVLVLLVRGASSHEIATSLCVSVNTVRTHIQNILMKLHVHTRLEAAAFAVRHGIVSLP